MGSRISASVSINSIASSGPPGRYASDESPVPKSSIEIDEEDGEPLAPDRPAEGEAMIFMRSAGPIPLIRRRGRRTRFETRK
ncbi:MAG: hypothetical protein CL908_12095 [Deltaproteobacteria bacterium]|nr:hypothetical protein [Deltaproteobacteria bacterium]